MSFFMVESDPWLAGPESFATGNGGRRDRLAVDRGGCEHLYMWTVHQNHYRPASTGLKDIVSVDFAHAAVQ
jgi:hypothetical protein